MPGVVISQIQGLVDPFKQYQFLMMINPIPGPNVISSEILSMRCTATAIPGSTLPQIPVELGGYRLWYNGMRMFSGQWTTTLTEGNDVGVLRQLAEWMKFIYNQRTSLGNFKTAYQSQALVQMYNDPNEIVATRTLYGVWPTVDPDKPLSFAANARVDIPVTWSYDFWDDDGSA
jgi:hypothetical protein